jgi:hypothetical protein
MENLGRLVNVCTNSERFMTVRLYGIVSHLNTALLAWLMMFSSRILNICRAESGEVSPQDQYIVQKYETNGKY